MPRLEDLEARLETELCPPPDMNNLTRKGEADLPSSQNFCLGNKAKRGCSTVVRHMRNRGLN
jgi:hypothetical protein